MAVVTIRADLQSRGLDGIIAGLTDGIPETMTAVAEAIHSHVVERFDAEADSWGNPWADLKPRTIARKARVGKTRKLVFDGHLFRSVVPGSDETSAWVEVGGPAAAYAAVHQFGSSDGRIPARPYLPIRGSEVDLPDELREEILEMVRIGIMEGVG